MEHLLYEVLENSRCIAEAKGHHQMFTVAIPGVQHCFIPYFLNAYKIIGTAQIYLCKDLGNLESVEQFFNDP